MDLAAKGLAITIPYVWKVVIWHFVNAPIAQKNIVLFVVEMVSIGREQVSIRSKSDPPDHHLPFNRPSPPPDLGHLRGSAHVAPPGRKTFKF